MMLGGLSKLREMDDIPVMIWDEISSYIKERAEAGSLKILFEVPRVAKPERIRVAKVFDTSFRGITGSNMIRNEKYILSVDTIEHARTFVGHVIALIEEMRQPREKKRNKNKKKYNLNIKIIIPSDKKITFSMVKAHSTRTYTESEVPRSIVNGLIHDCISMQMNYNAKNEVITGKKDDPEYKRGLVYEPRTQVWFMPGLHDEVVSHLAVLDIFDKFDLAKQRCRTHDLSLRYTVDSGSGYRVQYFDAERRLQVGLGDILIAVGCEEMMRVPTRKNRDDRLSLKEKCILGSTGKYIWWLLSDNVRVPSPSKYLDKVLDIDIV